MTQVINSTFNGYLGPLNSILEDDDLEDFLHDFIQGITNVDNTLIRPDWQQFPPNQPDISSIWISFGILKKTDDYVPSTKITPDTYSIIRNQVLEVLISFYGPASGSTQGIFRDGCSITQNRDILTQNGFAIISLSEPRNLSFQLNGQWVRRIDQIIRSRRVIEREYPIETLTSGAAGIYLDTEKGEVFIPIST
jgi:hypothetical protein